MGRLSDGDANNALDSRFGAAPVAVPASYLVALSSTDCDPAGPGMTEPTGGGYMRVPIANDSSGWAPATARRKTSAVDVVFPQATAAWGMIGYFALCDPGGTVRAWGEIPAPLNVVTGAQPTIPAGSLVIEDDA